MSKSYISHCPRCGTRSFESLGNYAHCMECLYVEDQYCDIETAYHQAERLKRELAARKAIAKIFNLPQKPKNKKGEAS
jgi:hypothetical protein